MSNAKYIGRVGALAVALGVGLAVAGTPGVAFAEPADSGSCSSSDSSDADTTALVMGGTTVPTPDDASVEVIKNQYIAPTHPGQDIEYCAVTTPLEAWPLTGFGRLVGLALGLPSLGARRRGVAGRAVVETLGAVRPHPGSVGRAGVANLEQAMAEHGNDHLVIYGYSQGAIVATMEKRKLAEQYPLGTEAPDIDFVLRARPNVPNGGLLARFPGLYLPIGWSFDGPAPTDTQFDTVILNRQYEAWAISRCIRSMSSPI